MALTPVGAPRASVVAMELEDELVELEPEVPQEFETVELDVNHDGYLDAVRFDPTRIGGETFDLEQDQAAIVSVQLGGVPVAAGEAHGDPHYGESFTVTPVTLASVEELAAQHPELLEDLQLPLAEHYAYAELVQSPYNSADCFLRVYTAAELADGVPVGRGLETDWMRNALAHTGGAIDDGTGNVTALVAPGELEGELAARTHLATTVDISVWSEYLTVEDIESLKELGVEHVIVGTQDPAVTYQQLAMLHRYGFTTDVYIYVNWNEDIEAQVDEAMGLVEQFPVGTVWLDLEEEAQAVAMGLSPEDLIARTREAVVAFEQRKAQSEVPTELGIYTSEGFWNSWMGRTEEFADLPLWYARWPSNDPAVSAAAGITEENFMEGLPPFGGFTAVGRQWGGNFHTSTGMVFDPSFLYIPENQDELTFGESLPDLAAPAAIPPGPTGTPATAGALAVNVSGAVGGPTVTPLNGFHPGLVRNGGFIDGWDTLGNVNGVLGNQVPAGWQVSFQQGSVHTTHLLEPMVPEAERLGGPQAIFFDDQKMDPSRPEYGKGDEWGWQGSTFKLWNPGQSDPFRAAMSQTLTGLAPGVPVTVQIPVAVGTHAGNYTDFVGVAHFEANVAGQVVVLDHQGPRQGFQVITITAVPDAQGNLPIVLTFAGQGRVDFFLDGVSAQVAGQS